MRRYALPLALVALAVAVAPANAAPRRAPSSASIVDPTGDWPVPSEDAIRIRVDTLRVDGKSVLRAVMTVSAAPDPLTEYFIGIYGACDSWALINRHPFTGSAGPRLIHSHCSTAGNPTTLPDTAPATVTMTGTDVVFTAPYALGLAPGVRVTSIAGLATVRGVGVSAPVVGFRWSGDLANGDVSYVLG